MKMIVGLGNPGKKYENTKHNVGFMVVDRLATEHGAVFKKNAFEAEVTDYFVDGEKVLLVKPMTFMNESGRAVGPLMTYFGVYLEELVVIADDLDMDLGKLRLRQKGSAGGHNGLKKYHLTYWDARVQSDQDWYRSSKWKNSGKSCIEHIWKRR